MSAPDWTYQPPTRTESHPDQCYYRAPCWLHMQPPGQTGLDDTQLMLYRDVCGIGCELTVTVPNAHVKVDLDRAKLTLLRDALNDALHDIAAAEAERVRRESFERIQDELREADELGGGSYVYYGHPDVHYVRPDQVQAKVAELEAAGAARYIVLPEPLLADVEPCAQPAEPRS